MFNGITHLGMWACMLIALWHGAQLNGGPNDDVATVLFWAMCGFAIWFVADLRRDSGPQRS
jgi:hypothetical protein